MDVIPSTNTDAHTFVSATADGISAKKDPYFDTAIPITGTSTTTITINILKSAPSTNTTDTLGQSATNKNLPPYYALCYIMKT